MSLIKTCPTCKSTFVGRDCLSCIGKNPASDKTLLQNSPSIQGKKFRGMELLEKIDQGGMGTIYRAQRVSDGTIVAVKVICPETDFSGELEARFLREANALASLSHPHIVHFYESGREGEFMFFSMEFVDGKTLRPHMESKPFPVAETCAIGIQICEAIQFAHEREVVHRDIKPENILINQEAKVKLADFGLAKVIGSLEESFGLTLSGAAIGTGPYMAPEQRLDSAGTDHRIDIFALGVMMYEMIQQELPPRLGGKEPVKSSGNTLLDKVLEKAMASKRETRFASAREMKDALSEILGTHPVDLNLFLNPPQTDSPGARLFKDAVAEKPHPQHLPIPPEAQQAMENPERHLNQYILVEKVGQGGMGAVWKGWDKALARWVAVKFLSSSDDTSIGRFIREAQLSAQLRHSNIAGIQEVNQSGEKHFLVMEFIDGKNLRETELGMEETIPLFVKVCRAIQFAHDRKIVHRDIKPANIMFGQDREPYVTDFGLAKILQSESSLSATGAILGSPAYMSPEQAGGESSEIAEKSDIYSLGATLYTLLTGEPPFQAKTLTGILHLVTTKDPPPPRTRNPEIPDPVEAIIQKAMQKNKEERYASAGEMADDLERFLRSGKVEARSPGVFSQIRRKGKARLGSAAALLLVLIGGGFLLWKSSDSSSETIKETRNIPSSPGSVIDEQAAVRFESLLKWSRFTGRSPQQEKEISRLLPKLNREKEILWLQMQCNLLPSELGPKQNWNRRKKEAERVTAWCSLVLGILQENEAPEFQSKLQAKVKKYAPVLAWRGTVNLRILITPYATLQSLRVGEDRVVQEGRLLSTATIHVLAEELSTPFTMEDLDIGPWSFTFTHPTYGKKTWTLSDPDTLVPGKTYILAGSWKREDSLRLR